jgi:hypothetical protein
VNSAKAIPRALALPNGATVWGYRSFNSLNNLKEGDPAWAFGKRKARLRTDFGRGFDRSNLWFMRSFYLSFPKNDALRRELTWTHYRLLLKVERPEVRPFYIDECISANWSTRQCLPLITGAENR